MFGTRASCKRFVANQFGVLMAALAYTYMQALQRHAFEGPELERATSATIGVKLLKIGAAIVGNTRRIVIMLASAHPLRDLFKHAAERLDRMPAYAQFGVP